MPLARAALTWSWPMSVTFESSVWASMVDSGNANRAAASRVESRMRWLRLFDRAGLAAERCSSCLSDNGITRSARGAAGTAIAADAFGYEAHRVLLSRHDVRIAGLPRALDGIQIAQISDVHLPGNQTAARAALE